MDLEKLFEAKLNEARAKGEFEDIKRDGPIDIDEDANIPEEERLTMLVMRRNDVLPEWIEADKGLRKRIDDARSALARSWAWRSSKLAEAKDAGERNRAEAQWQRARSKFEAEISAINREIFLYNLKTTVPQTQRRPLRIEEELQRLRVTG